MANSSAKRLHKANTQRLNTLRVAILIATVAYAVRWFLFSGQTSIFHRSVFIILTVLQAIAFSLIWLAAKPTYSPDGNLIDAGHDISEPGVLEYIHDIIYLTVFVQVLLLITPWALLFYLIIPFFAIYLLCFSGSNPFSERQEDQPVDEYAGLSRKERRKAERAARKQR